MSRLSISRRDAVAGAVAAIGVGAAINPARAAEASRGFTVLRDGSDIGRHRITLRRQGEDLHVTIDVDIAVSVLGVTVYRYEMINREVWRDGLLQSIDSSVNDDGDRKYVKASREGGELRIDATYYSGPAPSDAATTTYFTTDFLARPTWISTDSGELFDMTTRRDGSQAIRTGAGAVECARWRATNGADYDVRLFYDDRGEWASVAFDASGEEAIYVPDSLDPPLTPLWSGR